MEPKSGRSHSGAAARHLVLSMCGYSVAWTSTHASFEETFYCFVIHKQDHEDCCPPRNLVKGTAKLKSAVWFRV